MRVGILVEGQEGFGWERWQEVARWAEELGFDSLWYSDHLAPLGHDLGVDSLDAFTALTWAATATTRIHIGTMVSPLTFRHPVTLARTAAALAALSGGRFSLGLGAGWHAAEHERFGIPLPAPRHRVLALDEGAAVVRLLLSGQRVSFDGRVFCLRGARIQPAGPVSIVIGGGGERYTLAAVAQHADEWNLPAIATSAYRRKVEALEAHCARLGRAPDSIRRSLVYGQAIASSEAAVRRAEQELIADTPPRYRPGSGPDAPEWLVGIPSRVVDRLDHLAAEGVERVLLQYRRPPCREQLELVAAEVVTPLKLLPGISSLVAD